MPYNFEATFTQPILLKLDNGLIKGSEDWADTITKAYITTIKAGLPQGVTPVIAAPGLSGAPFTIGASGFNTAESKEKAMYTLIHAYFAAKELSLNKASIEGLILTVKQLIRKIKNKQQQVKTIIDEIRIINEELKQLPPLLKEIEEAIKDVFKEQLINVANIETSLSFIQADIKPETFSVLFAKELQVINTIKSFNVRSIDNIRTITLFVSEYGQRTVTTLGATASEQALKNYIQSRLVEIAREFLTLANGLIDPLSMMDYLRQLSPARPKIKILYQKVERFTILQTLLKPQLIKLQVKKNILIKDIRDNLQTRLIALREKLQKRINEHSSKKKEGKADLIFKKAKTNINRFKKENEAKIKKTKKKIKLYTKASKSIVILTGKTTNLIQEVSKQFTAIQQEIVDQQKNIQEIQTTYREGLNISAEVNKVREYASFLKLERFANQMALVIIQTKCSFQTFKHFFERNNAKIETYVLEMQSIEDELKNLSNTIKDIRELDKGVSSNTKTPPQQKKHSVKTLLQDSLQKLAIKIQKLHIWIAKQIEEQTVFLKTKIEKFKNDLDIFLLTLIPLKSDVEDTKNKKLVAESKKKKLQDKKTQIEKIAKLTKYVYSMSAGATTLTKNLNEGKYRFAENELPINKILNGYYSFKKEDQPQAVQVQLDKEKEKLREDFEALKIIEMLIYGIIETANDMKNTNFAAELKQIINNTPQSQTLKLVLEISENPPKNPTQVRNIAQALGGSVLQDVSAANTIIGLERKYLLRSREAVRLLCDTKLIKNIKVKGFLNKVSKNLDKNQSFILLAFKYLKEQLQAFVKFINKKIKKASQTIITRLNKRTQEKQKQVEKDLKKIAENKTNPDATAMSIMFGLAARAFWTGATWVGPTGSTHTVINIGTFKKIKAKTADGASGMVREMSRSFEGQLRHMFGLITPPPNTLIPPLPFNGYI